MKTFLPCFLIIVLLSFAQVPGDVKEVVAAFKEKNPTKISQYFDQTVQFNLNGKTGTYSKDQASVLLKGFFQNYNVTDFELMHTGSSGNADYFVGILRTKSARFRTAVYLKSYLNKKTVQDISIEQQ